MDEGRRFTECLLFDFGNEIQLNGFGRKAEDGPRRLIFLLADLVFHLDDSVILDASLDRWFDDTRVSRSSDLVFPPGCGSGKGDLRVNMVGAFPRAFAEALWGAGKRWVYTVQVPVQIAEVTFDDFAPAHGRLVAFVA